MTDSLYPLRVLNLDFNGVAGSEEITNGGFDTDTDWVKGTGWAISGGVATKTPGAGAIALEQDLGAIVDSQPYRVEVTVSGRTAGFIYARLGGATNLATMSVDGTYVFTLTAESANESFWLIPDVNFDGSVDDVSVKSFISTTATDKSALEHTVGYVSGAKLETNSPISGDSSLFLDGTNDAAVITGGHEFFNLKLSAYCIEFDFKSSDTPAGDAGFIGCDDTASGLRAWNIYFDQSDNSIVFAYSSNGSATTDEVKFDMDTDNSGNTDVFDGSTHHIAAYRKIGGGMYIAVDGIVAANTDNFTGAIETNPDQDLDIGCFRTSGSRAGFIGGLIDNVRITLGSSVYTAESGSFTPDSRPFDVVDPGAGASYAYPLTIDMHNEGAELYSYFPWRQVHGNTDGGMCPVHTGGPAARTGSYVTTPGAINTVNGAPTNQSAGTYYADFDLSRYDADFLTDVDLGILEANYSVYCYIENLLDGIFQLKLEFLDASGNVLGRSQNDMFIPGSAATWVQSTHNNVNVPKLTRTVRAYIHGAKHTNAYADTKYFVDDFALTLTEASYASNTGHDTTYFSDVDDMVANWDGGAGTITIDDNTGQGNTWDGEVCYSSTSLGTDVESESPLFNLTNNTDDIDAGDVDFEASCMMANNSDSCSFWIDFYEADGTTQVGSRTASTQEVRTKYGHLVTITGTIPAGAEKAKVGFVTDNGASSSRFNARDVWVQELGPGGQASLGGGAAATAVMTTILM